MKKTLFCSLMVSSFCLVGAAAQAQQTNPAAATRVANTESTQAQATKTTPVFYGTDGEFPFSSAVRVGNTLYLSGQIGMQQGKLVKGGVKAETEQALDNINNTLLKYGYQKSDLVKCMAMLTDMDDFKAFNEGYKAKLSSPYPARSAFEVSGLAVGASVEIECMAVK